jgi:predicted secreted acid phosphatase
VLVFGGKLAIEVSAWPAFLRGMFKRAFSAALVIGFTLIFTCNSVLAVEPANLSLRKLELVNYVSSGDYARDVAAVALSANKYLAKRIPQGAKTGMKLAIVFDIDETLLSNLIQIVANDYGYVPKVWDRWIADGQAPAIIPVQTVYDAAVRGKIDIFIITSRKESDRAGTERNLRQVGYETWTRIIYKPSTEQPLSNAGFKTDARRKLTQEGYLIIANIGDQDSDLSNGYAERTFKLPNPFYLSK